MTPEQEQNMWNACTKSFCAFAKNRQKKTLKEMKA